MGGVTLSALPFSAVVGQDDAKLALLLAAIEPRLGGVLLRGDKGSAKTTLARGLAALLPGGAPFVELPLGAGEDRVLGALDVAALLDSREHAFRPGLLAAAHGGVLYVDEVNLLADHLVDVLLDVAVSGVHRVERDGFSHAHPARFVLVGSMNPEEGELRPQLLDRFGLAVDVRAPDDPTVRAEIVRRQLALDATGAADPEPDAQLRRSLAAARPAACADAVVVAAAELAVAVGAEGLRADLALCRAAGALAGLEGGPVAGAEHLRRVAPLVLGHRRRRDPFEAPGIADDELSAALDKVLGDSPAEPSAPGGPPSDPRAGGGSPSGPGGGPPSSSGGAEPTPSSEGPPAAAGDGRGPHPAQDAGAEGRGGPDASTASDPRREQAPGALPTQGPAGEVPAVDPQGLSLARLGDLRRRGGEGGRGGGAGPATRGRRLREVPLDTAHRSVDVVASATAYAVRTAGSPASSGLRAEDLRAAERAAPQATLVIVAVDTSGSIAGRRRLEAARAAVVSLLTDAYRRRDRVALVAFGGEAAEVVLRPTGSVEVARARLATLEAGGRTPLGAGLREVTALVRQAQRSEGPRPVVVLVTDGRATSGGEDPLAAAHSAAAELATTGVASLVVDAETGPVRLGLARSLAETLSASYVLLEDLERPAGGEALAETIRSRVLAPAAG
jgi:magnesium chelatase subunit D